MNMDRDREMSNDRFCRICFVKEGENTDNIFSEISESVSAMQLLSVGNIEIFDGDGLPDLICHRCRIILSNAYKFKQCCKKSDTQLKMYPITRTIPPKITIPQDPLPEFVSTSVEKLQDKELVSMATNTEDMGGKLQEVSIQTDPVEEMSIFLSSQEDSSAIIAPFEDEQFEAVKIPFSNKRNENIKILNKATPDKVPAKQFKRPTIKIEKIERFQPKILNSHLQIPKLEETVIETIEETADGSIQISIYPEEEYLEEEEIQQRKGEENMDKSEEGIVYTCAVCERSFPLLQQLEIHKQNHERARDHKCNVCDKAFFTKYDLAKHLLTHTKQKDYTCIVCKKSFSRSTLLYRHEKIHNDPKIPRYHCEHCDRVYLNKMDYDKHQVTHSKNRPFACGYCDKRFAFKQGLERHEVVHDTQSLPHVCEYCSSRFKTPAMLQRHLSAAHAGTRAFPCSKCSKRFMFSHHLYRHMRTSHQNEEEAIVLQCPECEQNFASREVFIEHCTEHALSTQICPMCKFTSGSINEINEHMELHINSDMYFCEYCPTIYMSQQELNEHLIEKHSNELCSIDEEEIEFIVDSPKLDTGKRKQSNSSTVPSKKQKQIDKNLEGASFIEYEEIAENPIKFEPKAKKVVNKESPKSASTRVSRVKMSQSEIERLKKEGKIIYQDGLLIMKP